MSNRETRSPPPRDDERSTSNPALARRRLLVGGATAVSVAVAGCLDGTADTDESETDDNAETDTTADEVTDDEATDDDAADDDDGDESATAAEVREVVDTYLEAAAADDLDTIDEVSHSLNPLNPAAWVEDGWEFQGGDDEDVGEYDLEVVVEDGTVNDVLEIEGAEFWFAEVDLEDEVGDEEIAVVEIDGDEPADGISLWALATEDGEWRVLMQGEVDDTPDDPEEAFEEEIIDEDEDVVEEIDWTYEQDGADDGADLLGDIEWAQVTFTDEPGIEADTVRVESTIEGGSSEVYGEDAGGWANSWVTITFHPDGDQLVVTAIDGDDETVVHREHYQP
ncbi:hypothetical protein [Natrarchaeobaculum sulfurireducens]|uniref:Uncharacterized protein n=1 Tax=Natrarchaeobaculum sulfurireducens TaxID=2044521 RepID=A0A346PHT6_9EURY|nr:hypothetical protein [Natrarchaeobaculum sulfurireducens]AXR79081.1 hypothetical protein AArc1_2769 [Natrarchaeobaculum sulfurireducens]